MRGEQRNERKKTKNSQAMTQAWGDVDLAKRKEDNGCNNGCLVGPTLKMTVTEDSVEDARVRVTIQFFILS